MVLLGIALFLIYAAESSSRVVREARIARLKTNAEIAQYAAEAGFNRVRARIVGNGNYTSVLTLDTVEITLASGATYTLEVTGVDPTAYIVYVKSTGAIGEGDLRAERVVSGTIQRAPSPVSTPRKTITTYD